jgi:DNA-binding NarL/FixJ family response regulator
MEWIEHEDPLECGVRLPARTIDWSWRKDRVQELHDKGMSLRDIANELGCSHEKVRSLLSQGLGKESPGRRLNQPGRAFM